MTYEAYSTASGEEVTADTRRFDIYERYTTSPA